MKKNVTCVLNEKELYTHTCDERPFIQSNNKKEFDQTTKKMCNKKKWIVDCNKLLKVVYCSMWDMISTYVPTLLVINTIHIHKTVIVGAITLFWFNYMFFSHFQNSISIRRFLLFEHNWNSLTPFGMCECATTDTEQVSFKRKKKELKFLCVICV